MAAFDIRVFGDPVLRQRATEVDAVDGTLVKVVEGMIDAMYTAPGLGVAAPQIGVQKRIFVYDIHDGKGAQIVVNPEIKESRDEWVYDEGCLSVPDLSWEIVRPKEIHLVGFDLQGNSVDVEADEVLSRLYQHEMDHLDGKLLLDYLDDEQRAEAMRVLRQRIVDHGSAHSPEQMRARREKAEEKRSGIRIPGLSLPGLGR